MIFEKYVTENREAFLAKVKTVAEKLIISPDDLMAIMYVESRVNHRAVNASTGATGLIQFMPATAAGLSTSTAALKAMSNVQQLDYVYKYLKPFAGRMASYPDVYLAVFFPAGIGKPDTWTFQTSSLSASKIATQNPLFDTNKDKQITKAEFKAAVYKALPAAEAEYLKKKLIP